MRNYPFKAAAVLLALSLLSAYASKMPVQTPAPAPAPAPAVSQPEPVKLSRHSYQFFDAFDTIIQMIAYTDSQETFDAYAKETYDQFLYYHKVFNRFDSYEGINNVKTINENAGIAPVEVDPIVLDVIDLCREWYDELGGKNNIALGPVLEVWHGYMERYAGADPSLTELPSEETLRAANEKVDFSKVITDREHSTVYLEEPGMMLDLGAVAKGYTAQIVADRLRQDGLVHFFISAGGNVVMGEGPVEPNRNLWSIGIQDPNQNALDTSAPMIDVICGKNFSIVTSGDYQRFYLYRDRRIHHIIDPDTLQPANYVRGLTVVTEDSGLADLFSTALFCMPYEQSLAFAEKHGLKVLWVFADGSVKYTESLRPFLRDRGGASSLAS